MGQGKKRHIVNTVLKFVVFMNFPCKTFGGMKIILYLCSQNKYNYEYTYAYNIKREEEKIDFNKTAREVFNQIRGMYPFPVAYTTLNGEVIKICEVRIGNSSKGKPGEIIETSKDGISVMCKDKNIIIIRLKPSGKKEMTAKDYLNGKNKTIVGEILC